MQDLSGAPATLDMPRRIVRVSPNLMLEMGIRENENDGSIYPAVSFCKYKKNSFSHAKNAFIGRPLEISLGLRTARIVIQEIFKFLRLVHSKY
jgi:hypothetical protein